MASQAFYTWEAAGKPYTLIRPARALVTNVKRHGITVYHYPDEAHLKATVPEDHCPFSATGWPGTNRRYYARGVDIMPRNGTPAAIKENADIARQMIADRDARHPGVMWIKYLNWTDEQGVCRQVRWMPNKEVRSSRDSGHTHVSGRSDVDDDSRADGYDPVARMNGADMTDSPAVIATHDRVFTLLKGPESHYPEKPTWLLDAVAEISEVLTVVRALAVGGISQADLTAAVRAALLDPAVQAGLAKAVNDDASRRLAE